MNCKKLNITFPIDYKRLEQHFPKKTFEELKKGVYKQRGSNDDAIEVIMASFLFYQYHNPMFYAIFQTHVLICLSYRLLFFRSAQLMQEQNRLQVITADFDREQYMRGLMSKMISDGTNTIMPGHIKFQNLKSDNIVFLRGQVNAKLFLNIATHVLFLFVCYRCGAETAGKKLEPDQAEAELTYRLVKNGCDFENCRCLAIVPELEQWIWIRPKFIAESFSLQGKYDDWASMLEERGWKHTDRFKPYFDNSLF